MSPLDWFFEKDKTKNVSLLFDFNQPKTLDAKIWKKSVELARQVYMQFITRFKVWSPFIHDVNFKQVFYNHSRPGVEINWSEFLKGLKTISFQPYTFK